MDEVNNFDQAGQQARKQKIISVVVLAGAAVALFIWLKYANFLQPLAGPSPSPTPQATQPGGLGSEIYQEVEEPAEKVPQTNPFDAQVNPYEDAYKNPFE